MMKTAMNRKPDHLQDKHPRKRHASLVEALLIAALFLMIWQGLSKVYSPLVLPGPVLTLQSIGKVLHSDNFFSELYLTLQRLMLGLFAAIAIGSLMGILMGVSSTAKRLFEPLVYLVQATPPILYITMAMLWFGLNGRATVFIVFIGSAPVMAVHIKEGFENIDKNLIEMGKAFAFSQSKMLGAIILPSLKTYFKTGLITVFGFGWKLVVMGEVLSASTGLGAQITDAKMNLETNMVFAWGSIVILLCFLSQKNTDWLFGCKRKRRRNYE